MDLLTLVCRNNPDALPPSYILPENERPKGLVVRVWHEMPTIDLRLPSHVVVEEITKASRDYGMFQVINHDLSTSVMDGALTPATQFFDLPAEQLYEYAHSQDHKFPLHSSNVAKFWKLEKDHVYWRDTLTLTYDDNSLQCADEWPSQPPCFRDNIWNLCARFKRLERRLLSNISIGLGFGDKYFANGWVDRSTITINRYPRCPRPDLTCGFPRHFDPNLITIHLLGEPLGLQICLNGRWKYVDPRQDALVVTVGRQLQTISNGILKAAEHRVISNDVCDRTTLSYFVYRDKSPRDQS